MNTSYGSQSMVDNLRRVIVRRPDKAFGNADPNLWHYTAQPNLAEAQEEHDALVELLRQAGAEVIYHEIPLRDHADAIYTHDPAIVTDRGAIILRMGKDLRRDEEIAMSMTLQKLGVSIHYAINYEARAEGGDLLWIDHDTLAVGQGFRTNAEGFKELKKALYGFEVLPVELPEYGDPDGCLHLMSFISIVDHKLAVVYSPLMPTSFRELLTKRGFKFVEVPESEFATMGPNVLALAPGVCVMLQGNPITKKRLEAAGCEVFTYKGDQISLKAEGGPTCLTRPILRG